MITAEVLEWAKKVWDYHLMKHTLAPADCILTLGSHDTRVAEWAAEVYLQGWSKLMIFSGGLGRLTEGIWTEPEADLFAKIAIEKGVPKEAILIENRSTNTGENILFTQQLLQARGFSPQRFIVVQKPYMERRSYATFKKHWPQKDLMITSPPIAFEAYATSDQPLQKVISIMVGDLQRIRVYPEKGFQIFQPIPDDVWAAYEHLVAAGFTEQLVKA